MTLQKRNLGTTGMRVSLIGLGTVKFGRNQSVRYPSPFDLPSNARVLRILDEAIELGINLIDTAPAYGSSEARLGELLGARRNQFLLCTKVGEEFDGSVSRFDFSAHHTRMSIERSLKTLRTDHLDIVLVHSDGSDVDIVNASGAMQTLADLKQRGTIRAFGISHKTREGGLAAVRCCDVVMTTLNDDDRSQLDVVDAAHAVGCGVLVKKGLGSGHGATSEAKRIGGLRFIASNAGVSAIVIGTLDTVHLRSNVAAVSS